MTDIMFGILIFTAMVFPQQLGSVIGTLIRATMDKIKSDEP